MKCLLFTALITLSTVLSGCVHHVNIQPGAPAPRVSINPAKSSDRQFVPYIQSYLQEAGYQAGDQGVGSGPSDYDLNFGVSDERVYVEVHMVMYAGAQKVTDGNARVYARPRYAGHSSVAHEAVLEAFHDLEVPVVRVTRSR